ncbi:hypothetical protein BJY24_007834 [Nocardia transvalensis]|uniref:Uncharacterized protein n=1 Tax=Nocardia transvalensis TaxID=37333 RepID=A0A7W9PMQ2_9NOCA|nr:hypothetical protein [Nocardia transvalensis]MBB5918922.1 hypothetical protein [Nocardia transvalensis]
MIAPIPPPPDDTARDAGPVAGMPTLPLPRPRRIGAAPVPPKVNCPRRWAIPGGRYLAGALLACAVAEWGGYAAGAINVDVLRACLVVTLGAAAMVPVLQVADRVDHAARIRKQRRR